MSAAHEYDERRSLGARVVATLKRPHLWIALGSMIAVLSTAIVDMGKTSPGPLASVHAAAPELAARNGCSECHGGVFESMASSCLACHELVADHIESGRGLHGALEQDYVKRCSQCHSDHHGANFAMVNRASFQKAGVPERDVFEHDMVGFRMAGQHLELECSECHTHVEAAVLPEGAHRFLGLEQNCASCHEDVHEGQLSALSCVDCHSQTDFNELHSSGHDDVLPLVGGHASASCRDCHAADGPHSLEAVSRLSGAPEMRGCTACHDSPHASEFDAGTARLAGLAADRACSQCHAAEHTSFRDERLELTPRDHAVSGFALEAPHADVECAACHDPQVDDFSARHPGRLANDCAACHDDPHGGQFERAPALSTALGAERASACIDCHSPLEFEPHGFDVARHAATALPLDGSHAELECSACHADPLERSARQFRNTPARCDACHSDAHAGYFEPFATELEAPPQEPSEQHAVEHGACARCHTATRFDDVAPEEFDHARFTGFSLDAAHRLAECRACHVPTEQPDEHGRRFGRIADCFGAVGPGGESCATCHDDVHTGRFNEPPLPLEFQDRTGCQRCHETASFRALPHGFDHGLWTTYALDGRHAELECSACHAPLRRPDADGRTWARAKGSACADCHADPHAGQFDAEAGGRVQTDCARCHGSTVDWRFLSFEHNWDSRFRLEDRHAELECSACHLPERQGELEFIRYVPLGTECTDCHGVQEGALGRGGELPR